MALCTILHTADWHLRLSQYSRTARGDDFFNAARSVVDIATQRRVDAIVNSGDILNKARLDSAEFAYLRAIHLLLVKRGIPMYTIMGNHDASKPSWFSQVEQYDDRGIIPIDDWTKREITIGSTTLTLSTIPQGPSDVVVAALAKACPADIIVYHGAVKDFLSFKSENAVTLEQMAPFGFRMGLLGDIHIHSYRLETDGTRLIGYPGSIELCEANEDLEKRVAIITLEDDGKLRIESERIQTRRVLTLRIRTEAELEDAVLQMRQHSDAYPLVFLNYDHTIPNALQRIMACVDPTKTIIRPRCATKEVDNVRVMMESHGDLSLKSMNDFLLEMAPNTSGFTHRLGAALLQPGASMKEIIIRMVEERRAELTQPEVFF